MNIPNLLTLMRFIMVPVFFYAFYNSRNENYLFAFTIFMFAGITDILDGYIARKYNMVTKLGMLLDPLADKVLQVSVLFALTSKSIIPIWIIIVVLLKELFLIVGSGFLYKKNYIGQANKCGKLATVLFYISILIIIFVNKSIGTYLLIIAVIITIFSAIKYTLDYFKKKNYDYNNSFDA